MFWRASIAEHAAWMRARARKKQSFRKKPLSKQHKEKLSNVPKRELCMCGTCRKCKHRAHMRKYRAWRREEWYSIEQLRDNLYSETGNSSQFVIESSILYAP